MSNELALQSDLVPSTMEQALQFSERMAKGNLIPAHLKNPADCLRVVLQAATWQLNPFAVADKTSVINGKLMYEGQLVAAVVNARGGLSAKLRYDFAGEGDARILTVSGTLKGETDPRTIELPFALAKKINKNGQMGINPDQQATYIGARLWARRHMPELMLGVYTPDEIDPDEVNVTPGAGAEAPKRESAPPKANTGAAGAKKSKAEPKTAVIETTATEVKNSPAPLTSLKDQEKVTVACKVVSFKCEEVKTGGLMRPSVIAEVDGGFKGKVYHIDAAIKGSTCLVPLGADGTATSADTPWQTEKEVILTLRGQARKDASLPCTIYVDAIKIIEPVAPTAAATPQTGETLE